MPSAFDWVSKLVELLPTVVDIVRGRAPAAAEPTRVVPLTPPPKPVVVTAPRPRRVRPVTRPSDHHVWNSWEADGRTLRVPPVCDRCDCDQTAESRFAACPGRAQARWVDD